MLTELWRIQLLGGLRAVQRDRSIERFRTRQVAGLLAYLAYYPNRPAPRDSLAEMFWPEIEPDRQRQNLRQALFFLRRHLDSGVAAIQSDFAGIRFQPGIIRTDVAEFQRLLSAPESEADRTTHLRGGIDLYAGPLLPQFDDPWIEPERQRIRDLYLGGLKRLIRSLAESKDFDLAIEYAHRALREDPYREDSHRALMRLYVVVGRPAAARDQFAELTRLLRELEESPSPETRELAARIPEVGVHPVVTPAPPLAPVTVAPPDPPESPRAPELPKPLTRLFGRSKEIESIVRSLEGEARLVTLTGPGGIGKTRLSLEVAHAMADRLGEAVYFAPLADLRDPTGIPDRILSALPIERSPNQPATDQAVRFLSQRPALLVLDNLEQLMPGARATVLALRSKSPDLRILVSSRVRLRAAGEFEHKVALLPVPPESGEWESPSVELFVDRARNARSEFRLTEHNRETIAGICRRLEGLPLAIELAAARIGTLTPAQILNGLEERFRILTTVHADKSDRHRSLWAAISWSYDLLPAELQQFLSRVSVFRGGWTAESASRVGLDQQVDDIHEMERAAGELLERLCAHSLLQDEERGGAIRYRILESIREFAAENLQDSAQSKKRHLEFFAAEAQAVDWGTLGSGLTDWLEQWNAEQDNVRAALERAASTPAWRETGLRLLAGMWRYWEVRSEYEEGRRWFATLLTEDVMHSDAGIIAAALNGEGVLAMFQGDLESAKRAFERALDLRRKINDRRGIAVSLINLGMVAMDQGEFETARLIYEEALAIARDVGDVQNVANTLINLGVVANYLGDHAAARSYYEDSLAVAREIGARRTISTALQNLAESCARQEHFNLARIYYREAAQVWTEVGDRRALAYALEGIGAADSAQADFIRSARIWGAAEHLREEIGSPLPAVDQSSLDQVIASARSALNDDVRFDQAWHQGRELPLDQVVAYALEDDV